MDSSGDNQERSFGRPWEAGDSAEEDETFTLPEYDGSSDDELTGEDAEGEPEDVDLSDWEAMIDSSDGVELSAEAYAVATTQEYQGLAEEVSRAAEEEWDLQAVAATVPGVDSGLVGFEDVTGRHVSPEEHYEADEQAATSDLAMRVASALIIFGMFLGSLLLGGWWFTGFLVLLMIVGVGEFYAAVRGQGHIPLTLFGFIGVAAMAISAQAWGVGAIAGAAGWTAVAVLLYFAVVPRKDPLTGVSMTILGMAWVGLISFAVPIAQGPKPLETIVYLVVLVAFNDIGAYFVGRGLGKRKLAPQLSPNKTVEGFIGGFVASLAISAVLTTFPAWEQIGFTRGLVTAAVIALVAPLGDVIESMVKRALGIKDMGAVLPGHGGILDRIDGFVLAVPVIYYLFRGFGLL